MREPDPIRLRYRIEQERPFNAEHPQIVVTPAQLSELPYDLWQQGHHVTLALHTFFPRLAYPVVRALTLSQRWRASLAPGPRRRLGRGATTEYLLRHVFGANIHDLSGPAQLVRWLNDYHQESHAMPKLLADELLDRLRSMPAYVDWPLEAILLDREAFFGFVREQWGNFVARQTGQLVCESDAPRYVLPFGENEGLQDTLPALVRSRAVEPVCVQDPGRLPAWARPALTEEGEDRLPARVAGLLDSLSDQMSVPLGGARWERWQGIARSWAELHVLVH